MRTTTRLADICTEDFDYLFENSYKYFYQVYGAEPHSDGWKLSIQGNTKEDVKYLVDHISPYLEDIVGCTYKIATGNLIDYQGKNVQQKHKLMTIYIPNNRDVQEFAEAVDSLIPNYIGGHTVEHPTSYNQYNKNIYYRNDRDENGMYIRAN